jgi:short subunit dehydrogenase-like uncharacterized protein
MTIPARSLDVVVFGATGFVGRLTAEYLAKAASPEARIGLAGRSRERLEAVRASLGAAAADWPLLVADTSDPESLARLVESTRVVATTVGPYARYGLPLVQACARAGTDYADLTGEVLFVRDSIDAYDAAARASGARIVHACGFDSIPSDLAVLQLHERAAADGAGALEDTTLLVRAMRGGVSGGTIDSLRTQVDVVRAQPAQRKVMSDPYALSPDRACEPQLGKEREQLFVGRDGERGVWTAPFVMAWFNTRIVRRSAALLGHAYGPRFRYREVMSTGRSPLAPVVAAATSVALVGLAAGMAFPPARLLLDRVLPAPGSGPGEQTLAKGYFRLETSTRTSTGARYVATVAAQGDPGYAATAVMLGESALCLALDRDRLPECAGVLTPATAMGAPLADRLRAAGFTITVEQR